MTDDENVKSDENSEPKRFESEEEEGAQGEGGKEAIEQSSHINATREEAAWEAQAADSDEDENDDRYPEPLGDEEVSEEPSGDSSEEEVTKFSSLDELVLETVPVKTKKAGANLRTELTGSIVLNFGKDKYLFEWKDEDASTAKLKSGKAKTKSDCQISMKSDDFFDVAKGKLNPQVAMLSDKIHVDGKLSLAVYFFNLFARQSHR